MVYYQKCELMLEYLQPFLQKKLLPLFERQITIAAKPVQAELSKLIIRMLKLPIYDIKVEIGDFMLRSLV